LRHHAQSERYVHAEVGFNYRMEGVQGLVLGHKLKLLPAWIEERRELARAYDEQLRDLPLALPRVVHQDHVFHLYVVRTPDRDALRASLQERGIETGLHYPVPLHRQPCFAAMGFDPRDFPVCERYTAELLSLPLFTGMTRDQLDYVCEAVRAFYHQQR
jgi:dTDP-4-amino-4,6-dideoxygalactose transaminase